MEVVDEVGLITCERGVVDQKARLPHSRKRTGGFSSEPIHMEDEVKDQKDE